MDVLAELERWYLSQCDGDWEHTYGIDIGNIDNPGWSVNIELIGTYLYGLPFKEVELQRKNGHDWLFAKVENGVFIGRGGPQNLREILMIFLDWAKTHAALDK